ncbi:MAG: leucine-rich repeat domain-containing protein [Promethearchaeota archaeon]
MKELAKSGDPLAKKAFKRELALRFSSGHETVVNYLVKEGYLNHFTKDELMSLIPDLECVLLKGKPMLVIGGVLTLSEKGIKDLSEIKGLYKLKLLKSSYLDINQIQSLPESIGHIQSLKILSLYRNQLKTLPQFIGKFQSLKELNLGNNQLKSLLESILTLAALNELCLDKSVKIKKEQLTQLKKKGVRIVYIWF